MYVTVCLSSAPLMNVLGCITLLVVVNGAGMNIHVQVSVGVPTGNSFGFRPRRARSFGNFIFLRNL